MKQLIEKAKSVIVPSDGFLTKTGALINYKELHSFGIGIVDGFLNSDADYADRLEKVREEVEDVDNEPHYFIKGWFVGQRLYLFIGLATLLLIGAAIFYFTKSWS